jgi:hypothetical protein
MDCCPVEEISQWPSRKILPVDSAGPIANGSRDLEVAPLCRSHEQNPGAGEALKFVNSLLVECCKLIVDGAVERP